MENAQAAFKYISCVGEVIFIAQVEQINRNVNKKVEPNSC